MTYTLQPPVAMFDDFGDKWYQETATGMARRWADTAVFVGVAVALRAHVRAAAAAGRLGARRRRGARARSTSPASPSSPSSLAASPSPTLAACRATGWRSTFDWRVGCAGHRPHRPRAAAGAAAAGAADENLPLNSAPAWRGLWSVAAPAACVFGLPFWFKLFDNRIDLYSLDLPATAYSTPCGGNEDASVSMYIDSPFSTALFGFAFFFPFLDQWTWGGVANKGGAAASEISILGRRVSAEAATCRALLLSLQISLLLFLVVPVSYDLGAHLFFFLVILVYAFALFLGLLFFNFGLNDCVLNTVLVLNMASITLAIGLAQASPASTASPPSASARTSRARAPALAFECIAFSMMPSSSRSRSSRRRRRRRATAPPPRRRSSDEAPPQPYTLCPCPCPCPEYTCGASRTIRARARGQRSVLQRSSAAESVAARDAICVRTPPPTPSPRTPPRDAGLLARDDVREYRCERKLSMASAKVYSKWHFRDPNFLDKVKDGRRALKNGVEALSEEKRIALAEPNGLLASGEMLKGFVIEDGTATKLSTPRLSPTKPSRRSSTAARHLPCRRRAAPTRTRR